MTAVLKFPLEKVSRPSKSNAEGESATILLFEGVQYVAEESETRTFAKLDKI